MTARNIISSIVRGFAILVIMTILADPTSAIKYDNTKDFTWIMVFGAMLAFFAAYGIGANDVANSFSSSVGAKSLTMPQAVFLASIFEFLGAVLMGSSVSQTMRKGIADPLCFVDNPGLFMYGMTMVCMMVGVWLLLATYCELPVSTTHSAVGGIIGMTMMSKGVDCVIWVKDKDQFPFFAGVSAIVFSWIWSPLVSGVVAGILYGLTYFLILRNPEHSFFRVKIGFPLIVGFCVAIYAAMFVLKGASNKGKGSDEWGVKDTVDNAKKGDGSELTIICVSAFLVSGFCAACLVPFLSKLCLERVDAREERESQKSIENANMLEFGNKEGDMSGIKDGDKADQLGNGQDTEKIDTIPMAPESSNLFVRMFNTSKQYIVKEMTQESDFHVKEGTDSTVSAIHDNGTKHDARTEEMFKYIQVFTAIINSFTHGANDVANAMGPFSAVYFTWANNKVATKNPDIGGDMYWILALGGVGIAVGLATYGYKIMAALGTKLAVITPSRGYCIELGAAFIIMIGTTQGWPLSTTHCQVGATIGVGLFEGKQGVNSSMLVKIILGWVFTILIVGLSTALVMGPNPEPARPNAYI